MITQLRNDYAKGQQTYPEMVQKSQALLTAWEGEKYPLHGSNEGLSFSNVVNENNDDRGDSGDTDAQASGGRPSYGGATETRRCYYCKNEGHLKPDCLKLKAKRAAEEAENTADGGATKAVDAKDGAGEHAHTIIVDKFRDFNTGAEDQFFFLQVSEEKFSTPPPAGFSLTARAL